MLAWPTRGKLRVAITPRRSWERGGRIWFSSVLATSDEPTRKLLDRWDGGKAQGGGDNCNGLANCRGLRSAHEFDCMLNTRVGGSGAQRHSLQLVASHPL
jgi:hypothetical protein